MIFSKQKLKVNRTTKGKHGSKEFCADYTLTAGYITPHKSIDAKAWGTTPTHDCPSYGIYEKYNPLLKKWLREHTPKPKDIIREALTQKFKTPLIEAPSQEEMRQRKKWDEQLSMESQIEPFPPAFKTPGAIYLK